MLREFTKAVGRYLPGARHDYPKAIWDRLATEFKMKLEGFTREIDNPVLQNPLKRTPVIHRRMGATQ